MPNRPTFQRLLVRYLKKLQKKFKSNQREPCNFNPNMLSQHNLKAGIQLQKTGTKAGAAKLIVRTAQIVPQPIRRSGDIQEFTI